MGDIILISSIDDLSRDYEVLLEILQKEFPAKVYSYWGHNVDPHIEIEVVGDREWWSYAVAGFSLALTVIDLDTRWEHMVMERAYEARDYDTYRFLLKLELLKDLRTPITPIQIATGMIQYTDQIAWLAKRKPLRYSRFGEDDFGRVVRLISYMYKIKFFDLDLLWEIRAQGIEAVLSEFDNCFC